MTISFDATTTTDFERAARLEWLETNGLGGWASSTVSGAHTRRYHGLLVAAVRPPSGRMVLLSKLDETLIVAGERFDLATNRYPGAIHPEGFRRLARFTRDVFPVFEYEAGKVRLRKTIAAIHGENTTVVAYEVLEAKGPVTIELRPFIAFREDHALAQANPWLRAEATFDGGVFRARPYDGVPDLFLAVPKGTFIPMPDWYRSFEYAAEAERGLDHREDLFTHGVFVRELQKGDRFAVIASTSDPSGRDGLGLVETEKRRRAALVADVPAENPGRRTLVLAADQFVVGPEGDRAIVAGYPWFGEWSRDTLVALPGLLLATGRHDDARSILRRFASAVQDGLLPNRWPEPGQPAERNTVDASLWMFVAAHEYLAASGDQAFVIAEVLPALEAIVAAFDAGTLYGIRADADGLLRAGDPGTQLTWMDARVGGRPVTPRHGRPVEVNALWANALAILADLTARAGRASDARNLAARAKKAKESFAATFWNPATGTLFDVVDAGRQDASIRPNAVIALALPYPLLPREQAKSVLKVVEQSLVTPVGLRSLAPHDPAYRGACTGGPAQRDGAYHQGTVWGWMLGPWAAALVRVLGAPGKTRARRVLEGLGAHLAEAGVGTISEIFDGDPPHAPRGCIAQAWSVGEILRAWALVEAPARKEPSPEPAKRSPAKKRYKIVAVEGTASARRPAARAKPPETSR